MMLKYRGSRLARAGFIGAVLLALIIIIGLRPQQYTSWASNLHYHARFAEAGGLSEGNNVTVAGIKVGTVTDVMLDDGTALVTLAINSSVHLGSQTTAHIRTGSLLGARIVTLESAGPSRLDPHQIIPTARTSSPYSLNDAVDDLTTNIGGTNTDTLTQSLSALSSTLDQIAPELGPTFDGLTRISKALNDRSDTLGDLLKNAADVTGVLSQRSDEVNALILNGNDLLQILVERRNEIAELFANTTAVADQLSGLVADNEAKLAPTLKQLNEIAATLEKNRDNLDKALPGLRKFEYSSGETVSNGAFYNAYVPNLALPEMIQPFMDYAFGFRAGDPSMPRAIAPWPHNGIPGGSR
jgi:phospholipid/cholesterol/gamma-HCH transport system substrate-binding protein